MPQVFKDSNGTRRTPADIGATYVSAERATQLGWTEVSSDYQTPQRYIYSNYGTTFVTTTEARATSTGEVVFTSAPTELQLKSSFPTTASTRAFTVTTNAISGDTITMFSTTVTLGTDISVGTTIADTVTNLVNYMNAQERLLGNYRLTSSGDTFTLIERFAGGGLDIPVPTTTGTIVISAGKLTESVWGYTTQIKHDAKVALEESAETIREEYRKNYIGAMAAGNTTLATSILKDISSLNASLYTAMQQINDEE